MTDDLTQEAHDKPPNAGGTENSPPAHLLDARSVADRLRTLGDRLTDPSDAERFRSLAAAVEGGSSAIAWMAVDPHRVFDIDSLVAQVELQPPRLQWPELAELARNTVIFAPVLVTWLGISLAVDAYHALLTVHPDRADQSFLYLWQGGFDGRLPWLTLGHLALLDSLLVGLVLVLSLAGSIGQHRENDRDRRSARVGHDIWSLLSDAELVLAENRVIEPSDAVRLLDRTTRSLLTDIEGERRRISELAAFQAEEGRSLAVSVADFRVAAAELRQAGQSVSTTTASLEASLRESTSVAQRAATTQEVSATALTGIATTMTGLSQLETRLAEELRRSSERLGTLVEAFSNDGSLLRESTMALTQQQRELLGALATERQSQESTARAVSSAALGLEQALSEIARYANIMHSLAVDTTDLARDLPGIAANFEAHGSRTAERQIQAAVDLGSAAQRLERSVRAIDSLFATVSAEYVGGDRGEPARVDER